MATAQRATMHSSLLGLTARAALRADAAAAGGTSAPAPPVGRFDKLQTKFVFGFATGADIGAPGEQSTEFEASSAFPKRGGRYEAMGQEVEFEGAPTDVFAHELSAQTRFAGADGRDRAEEVLK